MRQIPPLPKNIKLSNKCKEVLASSIKRKVRLRSAWKLLRLSREVATRSFPPLTPSSAQGRDQVAAGTSPTRIAQRRFRSAARPRASRQPVGGLRIPREAMIPAPPVVYLVSGRYKRHSAGRCVSLGSKLNIATNSQRCEDNTCNADKNGSPLSK
jgi:hypothetical protein